MPIDVRIDYRALERLVGTPSGDVGRWLYRVCLRVEAAAKQNAPVRTGRLRASITTEITHEPGRLIGRVTARTNYAIYQEEGTGLIRPRRAKVLAFQIDGQWVFTKRTRGVPATHFLKRAVEQTVPWPNRDLE